MERILYVCKELERARKQVGLPPKQPLLQLENSSKTACYSNSGTNLLLSSPRISRFLAGLLDCWTVGLLGSQGTGPQQALQGLQSHWSAGVCGQAGGSL